MNKSISIFLLFIFFNLIALGQSGYYLYSCFTKFGVHGLCEENSDLSQKKCPGDVVFTWQPCNKLKHDEIENQKLTF